MAIPKNINKRSYMFTDDIKFLQKIIIFHPKYKNKFLTLKKSPSEKSRPDCWDLPGGNVLFGELHLVSLSKEIKEETCLKARDIEIKELLTNYENNIYYIFAGYAGKASSENVKLSHEHSEFRWVAKSEFLKLKSAEYLMDFVKKVV